MMTETNIKALSSPEQSRLMFWSWTIIVLTCSIYLGLSFTRGYQFDSSIMTLLPESRHSIAKSLANSHLVDATDQRLVLLLQDNDKSRSASAAELLTSTLKSSQLFSEVQGKITELPGDLWQQFYLDHRYQLLSYESRERLRADDSTLVDESLGRLYSPLASVIGSQLVEDPLQLFFQWRLAVTPQLPFSLEDGWLTRSDQDQHYRLIATRLSGNPYDIGYQQKVMALLANTRASLAPETQLLSSGLILHAAHGAEQAIGEISTIGLGSVTGILLLLLICFRSARTVALAFLPIIVGCGVALAFCLALFQQVHLITLAFGAGLVGVSIDYVLHFLCAHNHEHFNTHGRGRSVLAIILPSLAMGLVSSVLAYAAQGMAPFPGLRQMAVFSVIGLVAAWLTVLCWLPLLQGHKAVNINPVVIAYLRHWQARWPRVDTIWLKLTLMVLVVGLVTIVSNIQNNDDIRLLQTSPPELLAQDLRVQQLLKGASPAQYLALSAANEQALLQLEEAVSENLIQAKAKSLISGFMATSQFLPSKNRQLDNHHLLDAKVYVAQGQLHQLVDRGGFTTLETQAAERFKNTPLALLELEDWQTSDISELTTHLWTGEFKGRYYSTITLYGIRDTTAIDELTQIAQGHKGVELVDRVADISQLLSDYREQLQRWLLLAYGLILILASLRYGASAWRVLAAPALASLIVMSALQLSGSAITIFHHLALLLVLGIGLDASIFLQDALLHQTRLNQTPLNQTPLNQSPAEHSQAGEANPYTWLAVTLSSLTTLLAFGLLALSSTPVLHYFGVTVLLGIICVWLLAPCFVKKPVC